MIKRLLWDNQTVSILHKSLEAGRVSLTTTDTVLGLLAACTKEGFEALNQIKGRQEKPYLVLVSDADMAQSLVAESHEERLKGLVKACWPGKVTGIFPAAQTVPEYMQSLQGAIGIRIPAHKELLALLRYTGPLFSTSANRAGENVPLDAADINPLLLEHIDYLVLEKGCQEHSTNVASTILDCTQDEIVVIRQGAVPANEIEQKSGLRIKR